jgi:hypothetical protein
MEAVAGDTPASSATFLRLGGRVSMIAVSEQNHSARQLNKLQTTARQRVAS